MTPRPEDRGAALLTVLLLVAGMSVLAIGLLDDVRFGLRRAHNGEAYAQARWYALGAESYGRARLAELTRLEPRAFASAAERARSPLSFPVEAGSVRAELSDGAACFNLNALAEGVPQSLSRREAGVAQFATLMTALGIPSAEAGAIAAAAADWIDSDTDTSPGGAEDEAYARGRTPYRTANTLMADVSELRAVRGVTPALYARVRPYLCALPTVGASPVNANTLPAEKAVVLTALTEGRLSLPAARAVLAGRPAGGWASADALWTSPGLADLAPDAPGRAEIGVTPSYFDLKVEVRHLDAEAQLTALFERAAPGAVRLVSRRWTTEE